MAKAADALTKGVVPSAHLATHADRYMARRAVTMANGTSRRGFLSWVGRASIAMLGGAYVTVWQSEAAFGTHPCGGGFARTTRSSCMCNDLIGSNHCPQCCGGYWVSCIRNSSDPASCYITDPAGTHYKHVRLYDCCNDCNDGCREKNFKSETSNTCKTCCNDGYCSEGGCGGKKVRCVRKVCLDSFC